jgi:WD40 repeat protein
MDGLRRVFRRWPLVLLVGLVGALAVSLSLVERSVSGKEAVYHGHVGEVVLSPEGDVLATLGYGDSTIQLWDVKSRRKRAAVRGVLGFAPAFSPDGSLLAAPVKGGMVGLWDVKSGQRLALCRGHADEALCVAFSSDGQTLASGSGTGTVKFWDVHAGKEVRTLRGHRHSSNAAAFIPDGKALASGAQAAFSPDGKTLASGNGYETVKLWDVQTGEVRATLKGHRTTVSSVAFSPDGKTLASADFLSDVKLWDVATATERATMHPEQQGNADITYYVDSLSFHPDGKTLATQAGDEIELWDVATGKRTYAYPHGHPCRALTLKYYFDDRDSHCGLFATRETLVSATFRADGKLVVAGIDEENTSVKTWILTPPSR